MRELLCHSLSERITAMEALGLGRAPWIFNAAAPTQNAPFVNMEGSEYLSFVSNDVLGLASCPKWRNEVGQCFSNYSPSGAASRLAGGHNRLAGRTEKTWADFFGHDECLFLPSGYQANACLSALFQLGHPVFADRRIHASMTAALALAKADLHTYPHGELKRLDHRLTKQPLSKSQPVVLTESLFSMDGLVPDFKELAAIKARHDFFLIADEAHAFGALGPSGQGLCQDLAEIRIGTLGKALGFFGAFILMPKGFRNALEHLASPIMHSTALPEAHAAALSRLIERLPALKTERARLRDAANFFRGELKKSGLPCLGQAHIVAVPMPDEKTCLLAGSYLKKNGLLALPARPPTVPAGQCLLRFVLTARHEEAHLRQAVTLLERFFSTMPLNNNDRPAYKL